MNTVRCVFTEMNALLFTAVGIGCDGQAKHQQPPAPDDSMPAYQTTVQPIAVPTMDLPVKEGTMPLAYIVETAGAVRVIDMTTKKSLAQTNANGQSIVSIDEDHGVSIGGTIFSPGPLAATDRYGIYVDNGGLTPDESIRTSTERNDPEIARKHNQNSGDGKGNAGSSGSTTGPSPHQ